MTSRSRQKLFIGLPASGKTTFLAALWYFLRYPSLAESLRINALPDEREYLTEICDAWIRGNVQLHTSHSKIVDLTLSVSDSVSGADTTLRIPDLSGELFRNHWAHRGWDSNFDDIAQQADGVLLFIHPNFIDPPVTIAQVKAAAKKMKRGCNDATPKVRRESEATPPSDKPVPFDPYEVPPQVMLVDQLQCLLGAPCCHQELTLSIIISAWDTIKSDNVTPQEWFDKHVRFLGQFIYSNRNRITHRCFGLSAQGCDYTNEKARKEVLQLANPADRIEVVTHAGESANITDPIRWLLPNNNEGIG